MDTLMQNAINARKNLTFETTGATGFPHWIFKYLTGLEHYRIIFVFPLLHVNDGWKRYKKRAINSYLRDDVFRFGLTKQKYKDNYIESYNQFLKGEQELRNTKKFNIQFRVILPSNVKKNNYNASIQEYIKHAKTWN